ncbi:hypothetical protein YC2023_089305 [Brassica napus]
MYKVIDHPFLIRFISPTIIDEVITSAHEINLQSLLDCSTISKLFRTQTQNSQKKQTQPHQEIQETISTDTKAATTSPPAHSSCLIKIAYMSDVNMYVGFMDIETYTNPIDQSIAHLLFHRPSDLSLSPDEDGLTYKSHLLLTHSHSDIQSVSHSASFRHHNLHRFLSPTVVEPDDRARKGNSRNYNRSRSCGK